MGYLFILLALIAGTTKGYCGKKTSGITGGLRDALFANVIRMVLCIAIGFILILTNENPRALIPSGELLLIAGFSGVSTAAFVVTWLICARKSAYMMLDIFLMLGMLIPLAASNAFFGEIVEATQWLGICILFVAVVIMCSYNNSIKGKLTLSSLLLLLFCGAANGLSDFSQKLFTKHIPDSSALVFNFYTYVFAALVLTLAFSMTRKSADAPHTASSKKLFGYILVMAICMFANSFFKTLAAEHLDAALQYPLYQGCSLIFSALMASVFFKEKLTIKAVIGILTAFAGLLIINLI